MTPKMPGLATKKSPPEKDARALAPSAELGYSLAVIWLGPMPAEPLPPLRQEDTVAIELPAVRILIVDDDRAICDYMQTLLERDGYQVKTLSDPTQVEA